jgi:hypothetical protein
MKEDASLRTGELFLGGNLGKYKKSELSRIFSKTLIRTNDLARFMLILVP